MSLVEPEAISFAEAEQRGLAGLVEDAEHGRSYVIEHEGQQVVVASMSSIGERLHDLFDATLAIARLATDNGNRSSFDDVLQKLGITHEELDALEDE